MSHFNKKLKANEVIDNNLLYYATIPEDPPFGLDSHLFKKMIKVLLDLAKSEIYYKEAIQTEDGAGYTYTVVFWEKAEAIRPWLKRI